MVKEVTRDKISVAKGKNQHITEDIITNTEYMVVTNIKAYTIIPITKATVTAQHIHIILEIIIQRKETKTV